MKLTKSINPMSWVHIKQKNKIHQAIAIIVLVIEVLSILIIGFYLKSTI